MSSSQRAHVNDLLRRPAPAGPVPIEALRDGLKTLMATMRVPADIRTAATTLGTRPALRVEPTAPGRPEESAESDAGGRTILYFHGGSWVAGSPESALSLTGELVARTGFRAYSVDYRLAPEHPFPAAIEDTVAAYRALLERGEDPAGIVIAGESAGGSLAITTCLAARDAGLPLPAGILAFSPAFDATRSGESMRTKEGIDPIFTRESVSYTGAMYLAGADPHQPLLSPALYADLSGFPPLMIQVGTNEILLDDSTRMAARATAAGVDVILDITADVPHVFQSFVGTLDEADEALERAALFLTQRLRRPAAEG